MVEIGDLTAEQRALLDAIIRGGPDPRRALAWSLVAALELAGHAVATIDGLASLDLVARWQAPEGPCLTLSPYGAWLVGVHILERTTIVGEELSEDPYWAETTKEPPALHLPKRRHEVRWPWMDEVPDPTTVRRQVLEDEEGEPVKIMGQVVPIDRRLAKAKGGKAARARRRAG